MRTPSIKTVSDLREVGYGDLHDFYTHLTFEADRVAREIARRDEFRADIEAGRTPGRYVAEPRTRIPSTVKPAKKKWWQA